MNPVAIALFSVTCTLATLAAQAAMPEKIDCRSKGKKDQVDFSLTLREGSVYVMTGELEGEVAERVEVAAIPSKKNHLVAFIATTDLTFRDRFIAVELIPEAERASGVYSSSTVEKLELRCDLR